MFDNLKADTARFLNGEKFTLKEGIYLLFDQGFNAVVIYRLGRWVHRIKFPVISQFLKVIYFLIFKLNECVTGISVPPSADIGAGFYIGHFSGIIVHSHVKAGKNLSIGTGVVIGTRGLGEKGAPTLGDNVYIGVGAKVLGNIKIGNNVRIGANAVVLIDVPDGKTVVGIPGRIVEVKR